MKVQFHIRDKNDIYFYPETAGDITMREYIHFNDVLLKRYPQIEIDTVEIKLKLEDVYNQIKHFAKKLKVDIKQDNHEVVRQVDEIIKTQDVKDNIRRFAPSLITQYEDLAEQFMDNYKQMDDVWMAKVKYPYMAEVVHYFTKVPLPMLYGAVESSLNLKYLQFLFDKIINAMTIADEVKYKQIYHLNNKVYLLPDKLMSKATLLEFAEAAQFDKARQQTEDKQAEGLLRMMSVLLRENGEPYTEEVFEKNMIDFLDIPLQIAYEVGFFLMQQSEKYRIDLETFMLTEAIQEMGLQLKS